MFHLEIFHVDLMWTPPGSELEWTRILSGLDKDSSPSPGGVLMKSTYSLYDLSIWKSSMWTPYGLHMEGDWSE